MRYVVEVDLHLLQHDTIFLSPNWRTVTSLESPGTKVRMVISVQISTVVWLGGMNHFCQIPWIWQ